MRKYYWFIRAIAAFYIGVTALSSCKNPSDAVEQSAPTGYAQPVIQPLKFSKPKKFDWDAIKAVKVNPVVTKLNWGKLPEAPYDTNGFKPFKYPVEETKFDYSSLPEKDLDIDKLPSHPLKFKTYILPPPKLVNGVKLEFKKGNLFALSFAEDKPSPVVFTCLLTDHNGFLWINTYGGLYRYDGENLLSFLTYANINYSSVGLLQDQQGNIWLSYNGQILVLDPIARTLKKSVVLPGLQNYGAFRLIQDKLQRIWGTSYSGQVYIINPNTETVKPLDKEHGLVTTAFQEALITDKNANIWIGTEGKGVNIVDLKNKKIKYLDKAHGLESDSVESLMCDRAGRLWLGTQDGSINVIDDRKNSMQLISEAKLTARNMFMGDLMQDNTGKIWIGTSKGLTIIDPEKRQVAHRGKNNGLASNAAFKINQDDKGQVWIAEYRYGLNMISNDKMAVEHIGNDSVNTLMEDHRGFIWATTAHGIDILDRKKQTSRHLGHIQGLANDYTNLIEEINGRFFITTDSGLDIVDTTRKTVAHIGNAQGLSNNYAGTIVPDKNGRIWMGMRGEGGINVYDPQNQTLRHIGKAAGLSDETIADICLDNRGRFWVSTYSGGIDVIDPDNGSIVYLKNDQLSKDQKFKVLMPDSAGNIWISSGRGIYVADLKNQTLTSIAAAQGLINDGVWSLLQGHGQVYAGTARGITAIKPPPEGLGSNKNWQMASHGLTKLLIYNGKADLITKDGLYWSGDVGITVLDLSKKDTVKPTSYITGISVFDHPVYFVDKARVNPAQKDTLWELNEEKYYLKDQTPYTGYASQIGLKWDNVSGPGNMPGNLRVPYDQNFIQFQYSTISLMPHDTTFYRYILIGVDREWSDVTTAASTINYMNLQPGKYTFEVMSRNADRVWSAPAEFSFTVDPPWSRTWWAYIIYVSLITGSIWCFVYYRSRQLVKEKRILEHKVRLRTEEVIQQKEEIESQRDDLEQSFKELKNAQTQLIQSEKMASLGELTAGIAHEIQNPLNFVNNFSEVNQEMLDELGEELDKGNITEAKAIAADIRQNEQKISHHGKRADGIVKGMLEHSRSHSGQKEPTDINAMADEFMRLSYHGLRAKDKSFNAELIMHFDAQLPKINVVQQDIGRVMLNLFNNAFYAVNQKQKTARGDYKPEVTVSTSIENGHLIMAVKDNGVGMPEHVKDKIMQPFFTTKPTGEGTGLGLSLTYDMVVKGHGGSITVNSKDGEGSEFIISLPVG